MERTKGPWQVVEDNHGNHYWHKVEIRAGSLIVAHVDCANAQNQGKANAAVIGAADEMVMVLEMVEAAWRGLPSADVSPEAVLPNYVIVARELLRRIRKASG